MFLQDLIIIGLQVVLPVSLLVWFAFAPLNSLAGYGVQVVVICIVLLALCLIPMWLMPPWWTPFAYAAMGLGAIVSHAVFGKVPTRPLLPQAVSSWASAALLAVLGTIIGPMVVSAFVGRSAPADASVSLGFPMGPGSYLVVSGGSSQTINSHFLTLRPRTDRQRAYRGQSYAVDLIKLGDLGLRAPGWRPRDPTVYAIFGEPVYAPCAGTVLAAQDEMPDMPVPEQDASRLEGNHVFIACKSLGVLLAHFRRDSLAVAVGDRVSKGQYLAEVGNSGKSGEPHLHIHAQRIPTEGSLLSGEPLFVKFNGRFPVRNDRIEISHEN